MEGSGVGREGFVSDIGTADESGKSDSVGGEGNSGIGKGVYPEDVEVCPSVVDVAEG